MKNVSVKRNTTNTISRLLNSNEVSELLGVRKGTLSYWRCVKRYDLPYVKIGRLVMYKAKDVNEFIQRRTMEGT